jgi:hypothetical protein
MVTWQTSAEYDAESDKYQAKVLVEDALRNGDELTPEQEESLAYDGEAYCEDESNACDWDNPIAIDLLD